MKREYLKKLDYRYVDYCTKEFKNNLIEISGNVIVEDIKNFIKNSSPNEVSKIFDFKKNNRMKNCGLGDLFEDEVLEKSNSGYYIKVEKNAKADLNIKYKLDCKNNILFDSTYIEIDEGAKVKIFLYLNSDIKNDFESYRNGLISMKIGKNAKVEIIKVQNLDSKSINFETMKMDVSELSEVKLYEMQIGSYKTGISNTVYMKEEWSHVELYPIYFVDSNRRMDLEQNLVVNGKNSFSIINAKGALKDEANKVFRGNIFLNNGCSRSIARFADSDIILSKKVKAISIPTIFCDEDDVIGEHAASFEALNKSKMLYLMSRGFDELSAKKLIINATFKPIFDMIDNEEIRTELITKLNERLDS